MLNIGQKTVSYMLNMGQTKVKHRQHLPPQVEVDAGPAELDVLVDRLDAPCVRACEHVCVRG